MTDQRRQVGTKVYAKAIHVVPLAQCARWYGTLSKSKLVSGTVTDIVINHNGSRASTELMVEWNLPSGKTSKKVHIRFVKLGIISNATHTTAEALSDGVASHPARGEQNADGNSNQEEDFTVYSHDYEWVKEDVTTDLRGPITPHRWAMKTISNEVFSMGTHSVGSKQHLRPIDYFMTVFPYEQLQKMSTLTSEHLLNADKPPTNPEEILKFIGVLVLATRFEFHNRSELWATASRSHLIAPPCFGEKTGMSRMRFDLLWANVRYSKERESSGVDNDDDDCRWSLVSDFVDSINAHRESFFIPSHLLCVDESISRWYGLGGKWIDRGLPHYVAIQRKPESGCEIQNMCCGQSGIMVRLKLVTGSSGIISSSTELHGTRVLKELTMPWAFTDRIVCSDSYFSSVQSAEAMKDLGLNYIGAVKTATRRFPMRALSTATIGNRGDHLSYVHRENEKSSLMAVCWVDRDRHYFISTCSSTAPGHSFSRVRWRQTAEGSRRLTLTVSQPKVIEMYYSANARIDQHNRCRQDDLQLERKLVTQDWSKRVNLTLLGMCIVDAWLLYRGSVGEACGMQQHTFYERLAEDLIENTIGHVSVRRRLRFDDEIEAPPTPRHGIGAHLTPTRKRRKTTDGRESRFLAQRTCFHCKKRGCTLVCSTCRYEENKGEVFLCSAKKSSCFIEHQRIHH